MCCADKCHNPTKCHSPREISQQPSTNVTANDKCHNIASTNVTANDKCHNIASTNVTGNDKCYNFASTNVTSNDKCHNFAPTNVTANDKCHNITMITNDKCQSSLFHWLVQLKKSEPGFSFKFEVFILISLHIHPESIFSFVGIAPILGRIC